MKLKKCATCGIEFKVKTFNQKVCSFNCYKPLKAEKEKKYRQKNSEVLKEKKKKWRNNGEKEKKCPNCGKEHKKRANQFCSQKCYFEKMGSLRVGSKNPAWKNGGASPTYNKNYAKWVYETRGLLLEELGCEMCGVFSGVTLDRHHIIFKSEAGWHKEINNPRNIVQCCRGCHNLFHSKSLSRSTLIKERELHKLFPELNLEKEL